MRVLHPLPVLLLILTAALAMLAPEAEAAGPAVTWTRVGVLPAGSSGQSSTLLGTGEVLLTGQTGTNPRAWRYNPATGAVTATANPAQTHQSGTATRLLDGRVLAAGGISAFNMAETYDPGSNTWSPTANMGAIRTIHTATLLNDGRVLVAGGALLNGTILNTAEIFNPGSGLWSPAASMATAHASHIATILNDGRVLVAGGFDTEASVTTTAESTTRSAMPGRRREPYPQGASPLRLDFFPTDGCSSLAGPMQAPSP